MKPTLCRVLFLLAISVCTWSQSARRVELVPVAEEQVKQTIDLPAEIFPYLITPIEARVTGYVVQIMVDRGSVVRKGQMLVQLAAPELESRVVAAKSAVSAAKGEKAQADAQLASLQSTWERTKEAARTPGAIAENELVQLEKQRDAAQSLVAARSDAVRNAEAVLKAAEDISAYLQIVAPYDGIITDRFVHPGALVEENSAVPLLNLQQVLRLRVTVPVPEQYLGAIVTGTIVYFHAPAFPNREYTGKIARIAHALDPKNRTMNVELDVSNRDGSLAPGMFPSVQWPVRSGSAALVVPASSVVTTTERMFVIRSENGRAKWVDVKKQGTRGDTAVISGVLRRGDLVVRRATDEIREGTELSSGQTPPSR